MYSIGHLTSPEPDDLRFEYQEDAEWTAIQCSYDDDVWAVWEDEPGEVRAIIYQQLVYHP